jgi:ATP synthase protein I
VVATPTGDKKQRDFSRALREAAPYLGIGASFAGSVLLGLGGGYWLDQKLGTSPWLLLGGSMFGLGAGFYHFYKTVSARKSS